VAIHDFLTRATGMSWGLPLAVVALAIAYRDYSRGRRPWTTALALAAAAVVDAYSAVFAALALTYFLYGSRRPSRTLAWLALALTTGLGLAAFALAPWLGGLREEPGARPSEAGLPFSLWPLAVVIVLGIAALVLASRLSSVDRRLGYALHAGAVAAALPRVLPAVPSSGPPVVFLGRGLPGGLGAALTLVTMAAVAFRIAGERRAARVPVPKEMPRALTPALLEASPPPPSPRRWGTFVPLAVWAGLLCWRLAR
jgi:hypothetical protein